MAEAATAQKRRQRGIRAKMLCIRQHNGHTCSAMTAAAAAAERQQLENSNSSSSWGDSKIPLIMACAEQLDEGAAGVWQYCWPDVEMLSEATQGWCLQAKGR